MPPSQSKIKKKKALFIDRSAFIIFALYVINVLIVNDVFIAISYIKSRRLCVATEYMALRDTKWLYTAKLYFVCNCTLTHRYSDKSRPLRHTLMPLLKVPTVMKTSCGSLSFIRLEFEFVKRQNELKLVLENCFFTQHKKTKTFSIFDSHATHLIDLLAYTNAN